MALDQEYFDAIHIDVVKKKYYNANKVEAVFADIRRQAAELMEENARMRRQLAETEEQKVELGGAVLSAQSVYRGILDKANARADAIILEAEEKAARIVAETQRQQDYAVERVQRCFGAMKRQHEEAIETIKAEWQAFLCGLYADEPARETAPEDLDEKIDEIARQLFSIGGEEEEAGASEPAEEAETPAGE